jgi:hypothetical protein
MKKILLTTNVITGLALVMTLFTACPAKPVSEKISNTCTPCKMSTADAYKPLTGQYVIDLISNYRDHQWNYISSNPSFTAAPAVGHDARSVWFSLNRLKDFIATIESYVEKDTTTGCGGHHCERELGIRIYFGAYGPTHAVPNPSYAGKHTLVMIPTYRDFSQLNTPNENVDFDPRYMNACGLPVGNIDTASMTALIPTLEIDGMNHGTIVPPPDMACTGARFMHWIDSHTGTSASGTFITGCPF